MKKLRKYAEAFSLGLQSSIEYRWNFLLGLLGFVFTLTIQYFMWTGIYRSSKGGSVFGYDYGGMIVYSVFAALVSSLVSGGFEYGILDDVKNGGLSKFLVRPIGYLRYRLCCFLGEKSFAFLAVLVLIGAFSAVFHFTFGYVPQPVRLPLFLLSVALSLLINFMIYSALAAVAFWAAEASGVFTICGLVINVLSGGIFPLDIFGGTMQRVFSFLPFEYTVYFSVNILDGRLPVTQIGFGLIVQTVWVVALSFATGAVWRAGLRKYVAVGG